MLAGAATHATAQALPAPWVNRDIGAPTPAGRASASNGVFSVTGGGSDIWNSSDKFHFVYQPVDGDVEIVARVASIVQAHNWAKGGVMIREALTASAAHAYMMGSATKGWAFQRRPASGATSIHSPGTISNPPGWVRLVRSGDTFSGYESSDGSNWVLVATDTIPMPQTVFVGLAVTSHNTRMTSTATFTNVTISSPTPANQPPSITLTAPASGTTDIVPATIVFAATASDADGSVTRVDFYASGQMVGSDTTSPYGATWNNVPEGTHHLTAFATDDDGATTTSATATVTITAPPNQPPTVSITSPANGATFTAPATITINANASDSNGTVTRVDFYRGSTLIASDTTSPYSATWSNVAAGSYALTAVAFDNAGASTTSGAVTVTVSAPSNQAPTVSITSPANGATFSAAAAITITATAADADGTIAQVDIYRDSTLIGTDTTSPYSVTWSNAAAGSYALTAVARDNLGATRTSAAVTITVSGLPAGWTGGDIGSPAVAGASSFANGTYTVTGAGIDVWGTADQFRFVYQPMQGDVEITARVATLQGPDVWSKGGVMIRETLTAGSPNVYVAATVGSGWTFQRRRVAGGNSYGPGTTRPGAAPGWVRLVRQGNVFRGYYSTDGSTWTLLNSDTIAMAATGYVGLAVTSHDAPNLATATFTNVTVGPSSSNQPPTVSITSPANGATFTAPASIVINASAADTDGTVTRVDFYQGSTLRGSDTTSPYSVTWSNVAAGSYALTAVAFDNAGASTTSAAVNVTVSTGPPPPIPTTVAFTPSTDHASGVTSYSVAIRRAGDPITATPVATKDLGKPTPSNNEIRSDISDIVNPLPAGSYYAVVTASGPGGSSGSTPSASFTK